MIYKFSFLSVLLGLACFMCLASCKWLTDTPAPKPIISITFDDQHYNVYSKALPLLNSFGYRATSYVNTAALGQGNLLTVNQVIDLHHTYGWEIGGHSLNHENLVQLNYAQAETAIVGDYNNLLNWGLNPRSFAFPRGECPLEYFPILTSYYDYLRGSNDYPMFTPLNVLDLGYLPFQSDWTAEIMKQRVLKGIADGENLIILGFHRIDEPDTPFGDNCSIQDFSALLAFIHQLGLEVLPLSEAVDKLQSR